MVGRVATEDGSCERFVARSTRHPVRERYESHPDFFLADEDRVVVQTRGHTTTIRGEAYDNTYCLIFRIVGDSVTEIVEHCDTALVERVLTPPQDDAEGWTRTGQ
jgi:ketosteroid isomerase-like protein